MPRLFDDITRTDATPARHQEGSFAFLNRVATPWWNEVRELLEQWFADYVAGSDARKAADLRARFRSPDGRQHQGAWWELYLYALLRRIYPDSCVGVEPEREGHSTRPDFCVSEGSARRPFLWVEAVTSSAGVGAEGRGAALEAYVLDTINEVPSRDFRVSIRFRSMGETQPRKQEILQPLREWLDGLNREAVLVAVAAGHSRPRTTIAARGWEIELEALPKGRPGLTPIDRLIGIGPAKGGFVDDTGKARRAIRRKASHYAGLEVPLVVAVMPLGGFFDFEDGVGALYGSEVVTFSRDDPEGTARMTRRPDGIWSSGDGQVSAVLFGNRVMPWTVAQVWPELWVNPVGAHALGSGFGGAPRFEIDPEGKLRRVPPVAETPAALFGLDPQWPGEDAWATT